MDVYEAIRKRRTIRGFTRGVSEEVLRKILVAGTRALSAGNCQPWEFIIVDDPELIEQISEQKYQMNVKHYAKPEAIVQKNIYKGCTVVAVCNSVGNRHDVSAWMCVQNMALAATAEGLGIVPSTFGEEYRKEVERILGLPEGYELATVMLIGVQEGYGKCEFPDIQRRPDFSWLHRNRFGNVP